MKKKWSTYAIYRRIEYRPGQFEWEPFDGIFPTLAETRRLFEQRYASKPDAQDYAIIKETYEVLS